MKRIVFTIIAILFVVTAYSQQNHWQRVGENALKKNPWLSEKRPAKFQLYALSEEPMRADLRRAPHERSQKVNNSGFIAFFPNEKGEQEAFRIVEAPIMEESLNQKNPNIRSYSGQSINDPTRTIRFSITPRGFKAVMLGGGRPATFIKQLKGNPGNYIVIDAQSGDGTSSFTCDMSETAIKTISPSIDVMPLANNNSTGNLRTYRLALAAQEQFCDEYSDEDDTDAQRRADVRAKMAEELTIVNGITERDFGVRLIMQNMDAIIYLDDDPFTDTDDSDVINAEAQSEITSDAGGSGNFDVGHLMRYDAGSNFGNAGAIGSVCQNSSKAKGFTTNANWDAVDTYSEIMFTHEFGHQLGANHTFTHLDDNDQAQMEPYSGSTIMSYGGNGKVSDPIVDYRDHYFHAISIQQVTTYLEGQGCGTVVSANNNAPTANAGSNYTIPKSTPFLLTGSGNDADGDALTYTWEQMDKVTSGFPFNISSTNTIGPAFRSRPPSADNFRFMPPIGAVLIGTNSSTWEIPPAVSRTMNFRFTVRDNRAGAGQTASDNMVVTVDDSKGPFKVTTYNSNGLVVCAGSPVTITWDVAGSDDLAENVKISLLKFDNGNITPVVLVASTPNDGSAEVTIGCTEAIPSAYIKVEAVGNIFYDINDWSFTVSGTAAPQFTAPADITIYKNSSCSYNASVSVTGDVTNESGGCLKSPDAAYTDEVLPGSCNHETIIKRSWSLENSCGIKTTKVQTITVSDNTAPTFTAPGNITIYKDADCNYDASIGITGDVTNEDDNCDNTLNATFTDVTKPGNCEGETILERTWSLTDDCNNTTTHLQVITVQDNIAPTFTAPPDITIFKDANCDYDAGLDKTGDVTDEDDNCDSNPQAAYSDVVTPGSCMGEEIITRTWTLMDDCGNAAPNQIQVITAKDNTPPTITNIVATPQYLWPPNHKMRDVYIAYDVDDNCSDFAHITTSLSIISNEPDNGLGDGDTDGDFEVIDNHHIRLRAERAGTGNGRVYTITIKAIDDCGNEKTETVNVYVVHNINAPISGSPFKIQSTVAFAGEFWDKTGSTHKASWTLDGLTNFAGMVTEPTQTRNGTVTGNYKFMAAGVYRVGMNITDQNGLSSTTTTNGDKEEIVVVYDPSGGHTYGGGWFTSPAGAYTGDPTVTGKASFGFSANYFKKSTFPKGETEFIFKVGDFEFNAINLDYLALAGKKAQLKGSGKIAGVQSGISFILTVVDDGTEDMIRMKIYNKNTGHIYYDNQPGASDADDPLAKTGVNSTVVVVGTPLKGSGNSNVRLAEPQLEKTSNAKLSAVALPNPTNNYFTVRIDGPSAKEKISVAIYHLNGQLMEKHELVGAATHNLRFGGNYLAGSYIMRVAQGEQSINLKLEKLR